MGMDGDKDDRRLWGEDVRPRCIWCMALFSLFNGWVANGEPPRLTESEMKEKNKCQKSPSGQHRAMF